MPGVNYIKHLNAVFEQFSKDTRLNPTHISLYISLFQLWNYNRFPEDFFVNREQVMRFAKIGSKSTYHRCIKELDHWKYLLYTPSYNPFKGSKIKLFQFETSDGRALDITIPISGQAVDRTVPISGQVRPLAVPISGQALVPYININKQITNFYKLGPAEKKMKILSFFKKENWPEMEAKKFFNHYQAIGWKIGGKIKIVDWQAIAQNWILKAEEIKKLSRDDLNNQKNNFSPPDQNQDNLKIRKNKNYNEPL